MPNNYLSVLYKHIIQVENKNVWLKVWGGGAQTYHFPTPTPTPHPPLPTPVTKNDDPLRYNDAT